MSRRRSFCSWSSTQRPWMPRTIRCLPNTSSCWSCWWTASSGVHTPTKHFITNMGQGSILKCGRSSLLWRDCFWFLPKLVKVASGRGLRLGTTSRPLCPSMPRMPFHLWCASQGPKWSFEANHIEQGLDRKLDSANSRCSGYLPLSMRKLLTYPNSSWWNGILPCLLRKVCVCVFQRYISWWWLVHDCYLQLDYEFFAENLLERMPGLGIERFRERLRLFLISLYYKNEHVFQVKLCFLHATFKRVCTSKILFEIRKGGSGKGMEAYLGKALFSDPQSATLDCGVFLDRHFLSIYRLILKLEIKIGAFWMEFAAI